MVYFDSPEQAKELADQALVRMSEFGLSPNPNNYMVWFTYYSKRDPELNEVIDAALDNGQPIDDIRCHAIYQRFFGQDDSDKLFTTSAHIEAAVSRILDHVDQVGRNAHGYSEAISGFSDQLRENSSAEDVHEIVAGIVEETRRMEERTRELEQRLKESSEEVTELKANLVEVQNEAMTDMLTGIANRRCFDQQLQDQAAEAIEEEKPMSLLLLDIDHFKNFNDNFGHLMSDQVLKLIARSLTESVKGRDLPARFGGEEFAIVLPETPIEAACVLANQIRMLISRRNIVKKSTGEILCKVSVSIGAGQYRPGEPLDDLIRRTDTALYAAKDAGRNRVVSERRDAPPAQMTG